MNTQRDESFLRAIFAEHDPATAADSPDCAGTDRSGDTDKWRPRHRSRWRGPLIAAAAAALITILATRGFGFLQVRPASPTPAPTPSSTPTTGHGPQPDVSAHGRVAYACTLALDAHRHGDVDRWHIAPGHDSGPAWRELAAVPGLLGALVGAAPEGHPELREPAAELAQSVDDVDVVNAQASLDDLVTWCHDHPEARAQLGVSADERTDYACALAVDAAGHGPIDVDTWQITAGDAAGTPWREVTAIPGLLGLNAGARPTGHTGLDEAGSRIAIALGNADLAATQTALDDFIERCR